ncbi:MAG: alanine--glyoxylate aminotransferase family protein [Planctomycetaceae bacterium]|nr:alanine--glyoxylate aminotransferase family protein [Planctomycetaceae bacterium]
MTSPLPPLVTPPSRILMGPGPSDVDPRVLAALCAPTVGHLDPYFLKIMDELQGMLRQVFRTQNRLTLAVSGTGSAGMETCVANLIEPGDKMVVGVNGVFGGRMADVAARCGAEVIKIERPFGEVFDPAEIEAAMKTHRPKVVGLVNAETSTGAYQPMPEIAKIVHAQGGLIVMDCVTSLAGMPVEIDGWDIDAAYSGTQKCLSCPPGLAPVTFGDRAVAALDARKTKVQSWYLDLQMVKEYWGGSRAYHHTAPINMNYALHAALRCVLEEGLEQRWARHAKLHQVLRAGLEALGLSYVVAEPYRLPMLNSVRIPDGIDDAKVRSLLLQEFGLEIGGGLGPMKGKVWRIGLMGAACTPKNVVTCVSALEYALRKNGNNVTPGAGPAAVTAALLA